MVRGGSKLIHLALTYPEIACRAMFNLHARPALNNSRKTLRTANLQLHFWGPPPPVHQQNRVLSLDLGFHTPLPDTTTDKWKNMGGGGLLGKTGKGMGENAWEHNDQVSHHTIGSNCTCHTTAFIAHSLIVLHVLSMSLHPCAIAVFQEWSQAQGVMACNSPRARLCSRGHRLGWP